jgi:MOSC domain-containing protein YiiM
MTHLMIDELEQGIGDVMAAPRDEGPVRLIVRRTGRGQREILAAGELDPDVGLVGDDWVERPSRATGQPSPYAQLTVMSARYAALITRDAGPDAWAQAGDQLYVDLDLSQENLPAGSRLALGSAVIEVSAEPHTGCAQFVARFGRDAMLLANSERGRALRLRGANAVVVRSGVVRTGDVVCKVPAGTEPG